ncbi:MAG: alpha/beta fold hydrolase [Verrucomicrobia bacterium]|nr:alpha/beta fold hydrolase [Verrucomicrobiota bacterium]
MNRKVAHLMDRAVIRFATCMMRDGHQDHDEHPEQQESWRSYPRDLGSWDTLFALPEPMPNLHECFGKPHWLGPVVHRSFQFDSPIQSPWTVNNRVNGNYFVGRGDDALERPVVLFLHGWNASIAYYLNYCRTGHRLARRDIHCALVNLPYHVRRKPNRWNEYFLTENITQTVQAVQQAVIEARIILRWLREHHRGPVGVWGISLGGWIASILACVERELDFAVLMTPAVRLDRQIWDLAFLKAMKASFLKQGASQEDIERIAAPMLPKFHQPLLERDRILLIEALYDQFLGPETIDELWQAWGQPRIERYQHGHISILMDASVLQTATDFIKTIKRRPAE